MLHYRRPDKMVRHRSCGRGAASGGGFRRQPLKKQQIELRGLADKTGEQRVDLAAMVGLVVEPMRQRRRQWLFEYLRG